MTVRKMLNQINDTIFNDCVRVVKEEVGNKFVEVIKKIDLVTNKVIEIVKHLHFVKLRSVKDRTPLLP